MDKKWSQSQVNPISRGCELPSAEATNFLSRGYEARGALTFDLHLTCTIISGESNKYLTLAYLCTTYFLYSTKLGGLHPGPVWILSRLPGTRLSLFHIGKSQVRNPKMNHTLALPMELINHTFYYLDYRDLLSCTQVDCKF